MATRMKSEVRFIPALIASSGDIYIATLRKDRIGDLLMPYQWRLFRRHHPSVKQFTADVIDFSQCVHSDTEKQAKKPDVLHGIDKHQLPTIGELTPAAIKVNVDVEIL